MYKSVIFTSDIYKIDDRSEDHFSSPQAINIDWMIALFGDFFEEIFDTNCRIITGEEINSAISRLNFFEEMGQPVTSRSWASYYQGPIVEPMQLRLIDNFKDSFVVGFELPPYLIDLFNKAEIPFVDLAIHPVRYLDDYLFGIRSNDPAIHARALETRMPESVFFDSARLSKARSARVYRNNRPKLGSALFLGQIEVDASLIFERRVFGNEELESALVDLRRKFGKIYYKFHPHRKDKKGTENALSKISGCEIIDANVYDLLSCREISLVTGFSSSALHEAKYFGRKSSRIISSPDIFDLNTEPNNTLIYAPVPAAVLSVDYWKYLLTGQKTQTASQTFPTENPIKFSLNQKWGR
jgi:hypothetical protein